MEQPPREPASETPERPRDEDYDELYPSPLIYVASLSDYNAGILHGTYVKAAQDPDDLQDAIQGMLAASPTGQAEEWAIHDSEGFAGLRIREHESLETISRLGRGIQSYGPAYGHWAAMKPDFEEDPRRFEEDYEGHWPSLEAYGEDRLEDCGIEELLDRALPAALRPYVRTEAFRFADDMRLNSEILTSEGDGGVYVFRGYD